MGTDVADALQAVLCCNQTPPGIAWPDLLLERRVGGLALLERHLSGFRQAGIRDVQLVVPRALVRQFENLAHVTPAGINLSVVPEAEGARPRAPFLEQRADVVIDPRLVSQLARLAVNCPTSLVCVDRDEEANAPQAKSPYKVGVPEPEEARPVDAEEVSERALVPIGLALRLGDDVAPLAIDVGRYYWHRLSGPEDLAPATSKILLATMKATDGVFARTNRRVSLRISRLLLNTPVTPNAVTVGTLVCGIIAGWLLSRGHHWDMVAGSLMAWFASMLDGVDGELARAKFQSSPFGHWLEMACDYVFYIAVFVGLGVGLYRLTGEARWLVMGVGSGAATVPCFAAVAYLKRTYARQGSIGDFYLAYERTVTAAGSNPFLRITPHLTAFFTRAVFPYFLVLFALLDIAKVALVLMFISTQAFWVVAIVIARVRVRPLRTSEETGAPGGGPMDVAGTK